MNNKTIKKNNLKINPELKNVLTSWLGKSSVERSGALESLRRQSYGNSGPIHKNARVITSHRNLYSTRKGG